MEYLDFDLEVTAADGGALTVRVLCSPAGTMRPPFHPFAPQSRHEAFR